MLVLEIIGNLGDDATARANDKGEFCTFDVAHSDKYTNNNGDVVTSTTWVSCSYNRPGAVLPYLKKGTKVYCRGRVSVRAFFDKNHEARAGLNLFVDDLVLCGAPAAAAPADPNAPF